MRLLVLSLCIGGILGASLSKRGYRQEWGKEKKRDNAEHQRQDRDYGGFMGLGNSNSGSSNTGGGLWDDDGWKRDLAEQKRDSGKRSDNIPEIGYNPFGRSVKRDNGDRWLVGRSEKRDNGGRWLVGRSEKRDNNGGRWLVGRANEREDRDYGGWAWGQAGTGTWNGGGGAWDQDEGWKRGLVEEDKRDNEERVVKRARDNGNRWSMVGSKRDNEKENPAERKRDTEKENPAERSANKLNRKERDFLSSIGIGYQQQPSPIGSSYDFGSGGGGWKRDLEELSEPARDLMADSPDKRDLDLQKRQVWLGHFGDNGGSQYEEFGSGGFGKRDELNEAERELLEEEQLAEKKKIKVSGGTNDSELPTKVGLPH